jgi:hypothetical protein
MECKHLTVAGNTIDGKSECGDCGRELVIEENIPSGQVGFTPRQLSDKYFKRLYAEAMNIIEVAVGEENLRCMSAKGLMKSAIARLEDKIISVV